jgi:hypothetical protein
MFNQFTKSFQEKLAQQESNHPAPQSSEPAASAEPEPIRAIPLFFLLIKNAFKRLFRS